VKGLLSAVGEMGKSDRICWIHVGIWNWNKQNKSL